MEIRIEKNVPIPSAKGGIAGAIYEAIKAMSVGDSVAIPKRHKSNVGPWQIRTGFKFTQRTIDADTIRVWRVA